MQSQGAVKGQSHVGRRKSIFPSLLYCCVFSFFIYFKATGVTSVRQRGIYVKVQMEVTGDLSCGVSRLSNCHTIDCFDIEPPLFVLIPFPLLMLFPKCGHLLAEGPGAYSAAAFFKFVFLSQLKMSAACGCGTKQSSKVFCIPRGRLKAWVTRSAGNMCLRLQAECAELFAWLLWQVLCLRGKVEMEDCVLL